MGWRACLLRSGWPRCLSFPRFFCSLFPPGTVRGMLRNLPPVPRTRGLCPLSPRRHPGDPWAPAPAQLAASSLCLPRQEEVKMLRFPVCDAREVHNRFASSEALLERDRA